MNIALLFLSCVCAADGDMTKDLGDQGTVELIAIGETPLGPWWRPDGTPSDVNYETFEPTMSKPVGDLYLTLVVRVTGEDGIDLVLGAVPNETAVAEAAPSLVHVDGQRQDDLKGLIMYVSETDGTFKPLIRGVVEPWKHGLCTVPSRWRTTDDRMKVKGPQDVPMFIVRKLSKTTTMMNVLHGQADVLVRTFADVKGEMVPGENLVNGPLQRMVDGKMEDSADIFAIQASFPGIPIDDVERVVIDFRKTELIPFQNVAESPKSE